jgi:RNA polymerase-binding transcription factor DksA
VLAYQETSPSAGQLSPSEVHELRDLLVAESHVQAPQCAEHETAARQLRDLNDPDSVLERELAEAGARRAREALADITDAFDRLACGTFGRCTGCGIPLPMERLEALPSARFCVTCPGRRTGWR